MILPRVTVAVLMLAVAIAAGAQEAVPSTPAATGNQAGVEASTPANLVIQNVHLISHQSASADVPVNLVVLNGVLVVVTRDEVPPGTAERTVEAGGGYLLGNLELGSPPNFMILDQDPRENIDVLLDTKQHVRYAVKNGVVVLNELPTTVAEPGSAAGELRRRAYTPPPIAVPLRAFDSRKWNRFDTKHLSGLLNGAAVFDRLEWLSQDEASERQVGELTSSEGGEIRALRLGIIGRIKMPRPWTYTVYYASNTFDKGYDSAEDVDFVWYDYRLDIPLAKTFNLSVGKQKEPISMERLMPLTFLPMQERSAAADTFLPARNFGIVLNGTAWDQSVTWAGGVFRDWIDADTSFDETPTQLVGRVTWVPFASADDTNLFHMGLGLRQSEVRGGRFRAEPEFNQAPIFVDTGVLATEDTFTTNLEASWRLGRSWLAFEYTLTDVDAPEFGDPRFSGWHVTASWALTREMRLYRRRSGVFDPLPVARSVTEGGLGAWEVAGRYSTLDLNGGTIEGGEMDIYSLGLNWWLTQSSQLGLNYRVVSLDRYGEKGWSSGLNVRLMLILD